MLQPFRKITVTVIALLLMALTACASSAPARFYILTPLENAGQEAQGTTSKPRASIGIGPVAFPAYLDRQQIVTRVGGNELHLAGFDEWAEPLKDNFTRVLVENLSYLLPADSFTIFPFRGPETMDWQVAVEVIRLDGALNADVSLLARWTVYDKKDNEMRLTKKSQFLQSAAGPGYRELAAAHSRVIEALSREMAGSIQVLSLKRGTP
ncbi:MAG: PqiC family protein [Deltaproteobacteria bacterium]|nr:PqiC family protein [Deltaproteobacteria bacterium]